MGKQPDLLRIETGTFQTSDGINLYERWWRPLKTPKAGIILMHGLAEHCGRHEKFARFLIGHGYAVDAFDLRGHGKSNGPLAYVRSFDDYITDLARFYERVKMRLPDKPLFIIGFSMGGTVASLFVASQQPALRGLVLSAPNVQVIVKVPAPLRKISSLLAAWFPKTRTVKLISDHISRDGEVCRAYDSDPLVYRKGILARTGTELLRATERLQQGAERITSPLLILHGTADKLVSYEGSRWLHDHVGSGDRTLKLYDGLYHEVMNEPEKDQVRRDVVDWLDAHIREDDG